MRARKRFTLLQIYSSVGFLASAISLFWLIIESNVSPALWLSGISPLLILLILMNGVFLVVFGWSALTSWRDQQWSSRAEEKIQRFISKNNLGNSILPVSLYGLFLAAIFLFSIETRSNFRITPTWEDQFIMIRSLMNRLEPIVFLLVVVFLMNLFVLGALGFGTRERYTRIIQPFALLIIPTMMGIIYGIEQFDQRYFFELFKEDRLLEWLTFWFLLLTGLLSAALAWRARQAELNTYWFFVLLGIFFILFAMEEISWGQRIFQIESPDFFLVNSDQQEINAHNVLQNWGRFRTNRVAGVALFVYGGLLPFLPQKSWMKGVFDQAGVVIPSRVLVLGFVLAALLMLPIFSGREEELGELFFSISLLLFIVGEHLGTGLRMPSPKEEEDG